jgi:transcriptional regulator with XRE-family HTH domain
VPIVEHARQRDIHGCVWYALTTKAGELLMKTFGRFVKESRIAKRLGLRQFCERADMDPSNWCKIERGTLKPPTDPEVLEAIAKALDIPAESEQRQKLHDLAYLSRGQVPGDIMSDSQLVEFLPLVFRTVRTGERPTAEQLRELADIVRHSRPRARTR